LLVDKPLRKICGWMTRRAVPSAATFSRAFTEFAQMRLLDLVHAGQTQRHLRDGISRNASTDASAIPARETPVTAEGCAAAAPAAPAGADALGAASDAGPGGGLAGDRDAVRCRRQNG